MSDQEQFIKMLETRGYSKSKFGVLGDISPKGKMEDVWRYQVYPELPKED